VAFKPGELSCGYEKNFAAVLLVITVGYAQGVTNHPSRSDYCPAEYPFEYFDRVNGFRICLPATATKHKATDYAAGSIRFRGFAVPGKTNLESKQLLIVAGDYDLLPNWTPFGKFSANGVRFTRATFKEGSAGHSDLHVVYTWKHRKNAVHFDFVFHSVNIANFNPDNRPVEYDRAAQIKLTERMMRTFKPL
jgi:hypothetical protein